MIETTFLKDSAPTFDPLLGFPNGRVARVLNATQVRDKRVSSTRENIQPVTWKKSFLLAQQHPVQEEMEAVQLSPGHKNYCADLAIKAKVQFSPQMLMMVTRQNMIITSISPLRCATMRAGPLVSNATTSAMRWSTA